MKIGELAQQTGVSVRTLHHYDEIALVSPSARGLSGHRIYGKGDVVRLHRVLSLKRLNFSLEEIRDVIGKSNSEIESLVDRNIESLENEMNQQKETMDILQGIRRFLKVKDEVELQELTNMISDLSLLPRYFSEAQRNAMVEQEALLSEQELRQIYSDLPSITAEIREAMDAGLPPADPKVLAALNAVLKSAT